MKAKTVCFYCLRKLWQVFAITLVLVAVIVSVLKYSLPYANDYKGDIEDFLYQRFAVNLSIGSISASWHGKGPALVLEDISFEDNETSPIALNIEKTSLEVNLWESIKTRQLKSTYFVINGFHADVNLPKLLDNDSESDTFEQKDLIESLFLGETGHFAVQNSSLNFVLADGRARKLLVKDIVWQNQNERHLGSGSLALPGISVGSFDARIDLSGQTLGSMLGDIYLQANNVDVSNWLAQFINTDKQQLHSDLNLQAWLSINKGLIKDVQVNWLPSSIKWQQAQQSEQINLKQGGFHLYPWQQGWRLKSSGLSFADEQQQWPALQFEAQLGQQQKVWLKQIDLALLADLARFSNFAQLAPLLSRRPHGQLSHAYVEYNNDNDWQTWFTGSDLGWQSEGGIPGAENIRISGVMDQHSGRVSIVGENNQLLTAGSFAKDIAYNQFSVELDIAKPFDYWQISSDSIWLDNDEVTLAAEMRLTLSEQPRLDLYAEASAPDANVAGNYFPLPVMSESLVEYLNGAIKGGEVNTAQVLFSGPFDRFPFRDTSGQFEVLALVENGHYQFTPDWPAVTSGQALLHFENERMDIYSQHGQLVNLELNDSVQVSIADLMNADELIVKINKRANANKLYDFFTATPLASPLANVFEIVQAEGEASADITLKVDLNNLGVKAQGAVKLDNLPVYLAQPGIQLNQVSGLLYFDDDKIELKNAKAQWLGMPLSVNFTSQSQEKDYVANVDIDAELDAQTLIAHGQGLLAGYLIGQSQVDIDIGLHFTADDFNYTAIVSSDLLGLESSLPQPYTKQAEQTWPLRATIQGDSISNLIRADVNNQLYFNGILSNSLGNFENAHFILGQQNLGLSRQNMAVSIDLETTQLLPWVNLLDQIIGLASKPSEQAGLFPPLDNVSGKIHQLKIEDINFNDFELRLVPTASELELKLNAKELRAQVLFPTQDDTTPIIINSDYLRLNFAESVNDAENTVKDKPSVQELNWLTQLPAIKFNCADCKISNYQLDKVTASLVGENNQLRVSELVVDKGEHILRATGHYQGGTTALKGHLQSDDIGNLFDEFDITTTVKDSNADIQFALNWQDAPYRFEVASLAGELQWELGDGHLAEISDGGARVFSLLSLDSLVRKLKLDFRDVFSKGFFYNSMQGSMQLDKGIAYTQDTKLDGVPADLTIKGHTNLNTFEIDYDLAVAPQVTSSLPVIVAWMVNPVTGLAALAIDKVIHSARVISEINFKVTGTMSAPEVKEIDRKSREVTIPQAAQNKPQAATPELKLKDAAPSVTGANNDGQS